MFRNIVMFGNRFGQNLYGVDKTPELLKFFLSENNKYHSVKSSSRLNNNLFNLYSKINTIQDNKIIIGGDHSMSIATIADTLNRFPNAKVLWIDAHADINTPETSPSNNYHGMPLAFLTGLACQSKLLDYTFIKNKLDFRL